MKGVQCYVHFGGIALKNPAFFKVKASHVLYFYCRRKTKQLNNMTRNNTMTCDDVATL